MMLLPGPSLACHHYRHGASSAVKDRHFPLQWQQSSPVGDDDATRLSRTPRAPLLYTAGASSPLARREAQASVHGPGCKPSEGRILARSLWDIFCNNAAQNGILMIVSYPPPPSLHELSHLAHLHRYSS